jgi:hypothetical protein
MGVTLTEAQLAHTEPDVRLQLQLRRRVKRGIVASYIRELSQRRNGSAPHDEAPTPTAPEAPEAA